MPLPREEQRTLLAIHPPKHEVCVARANEFIARVGMSAPMFAEELRREYGRMGRSTALIYLRGDYEDHMDRQADTRWMDARVWDYCENHWPKPRDNGHAEPILNTRGCKIITGCFEEAIHEGVNSLIYGPPSAEKSFVLENLVQQRRDAGQNDACYIYCDDDLAPMALLQRVAREAEVWLSRAWTREHWMNALIESFARRRYPPALVFDEAQHLPLKTLEIVRGLHDRTRRRNRPGCGMILAGSHNLYADFMHPSRRPRLEQWLSRLPNREQLSGMTREEVLEIASSAWGNKRAKFNEQQQERILAACEVADPYATDGDGGPLRDDKGKPVVRTYYSARRLLHYIRQQKKNTNAVLVREGVA